MTGEVGQEEQFRERKNALEGLGWQNLPKKLLAGDLW